jgi:hypothetical protein
VATTRKTRRDGAQFDRPELTSTWYKIRKNRAVQTATLVLLFSGTGVLVFHAVTSAA